MHSGDATPQATVPFPVYVISMDNVRHDRTLEELKKAGLDSTRAPGVDATSLTKQSPSGVIGGRGKEAVSTFCRVFCPDKVVGSGLAHLNVATRFLSQTSVTQVYCLVLEDDVKVTDASRCTYAAISAIASRAKASFGEWDIIRLHCFGRCGKWPGEQKGDIVATGILAGSLAAYLLSRSGAEKLSKLKLIHYLDLGINSPHFVTLNGPRVFETFDPLDPPIIGGQSWRFWVSAAFVSLPGTDVAVPLGAAGASLLALAFFACFRYAVAFNLFLAVGGVSSGAAYATTAEAHHYRASNTTHFLAEVIAFSVLIGCVFIPAFYGRTTPPWSLVPAVILSYAMVGFHVVTWMGKGVDDGPRQTDSRC